MQVVPLFVFSSFGKIEFAARKDLRIGRHWQTFLHFLRGKGRELRQKREAPFANSLAHLVVAHISEKDEWCGSPEFLALKKQWRPWSKQEQCSHRAITAG